MLKWFSNLKIKQKLVITFSLLIAFLIVIAVTALYSISSINSNVNKIADVDFPSIDLLLQLDRDMQQALVAQRTMLYTTPGTEEFNTLIEDNDSNIKQMNERWEQFKAIEQPGSRQVIESGESNHMQELTDQFDMEKDKWVEISKRLISSIQSDTSADKAGAKALSAGEAGASFESAREIINQLTEVVEKSADQSQVMSEESYNSAFMIMIVGSIIIVFIAVVAAFMIIKMLAKPLEQASYMMSEMSKGKLNARVKINRDDEVGMLAKAMDSFADNLQNFVKVMYNVADGDLSTEVRKTDEQDEIAPALNKIIITLRELKSETNFLIQAAREGKLETRGNEDKFNGGYREIVRGINETLNAIIAPVKEGVTALEKLSTGDVTVRITSNYKGDHQLIKNSINAVTESLSRTISDVNKAIKATSNSSGEISSSTEEMAAGAQEQSAQTSEVAAAIEEMTKTIIETTRNATAAADNAKKAGHIAGEGGKAVKDTVDGMQRIAEVVQSSAETVKKLGQSSDQIGEIVQVIDDIADQTNLLALNAAIEAARAGEQGRGFAVVADEVRKLAERTTKATKEIAVMIKQIQTDTAKAVESMNRGTEEVEKGKELARKAGESLKEIIGAAVKVVDDITQVATASEEQSSTAEQVSKSIESISNVTNETAAGIQQVARAAEDLNKLTDNLQELVSQFRIDDDNRESGYYVRQNGKLVNIN
jgi:methyl-accepting chemotaxis protein